jgi:hypothetical protein
VYPDRLFIQQSPSKLKFPSAKLILKSLGSEIFTQGSEALLTWLNEEPADSKDAFHLTQAVQLIVFAHYLLERCCMTTITPDSQEWALDMFQSLNSTGTPLTAVETFKPQVMDRIRDIEGKYEGSTSSDHFAKVAIYLDDLKNEKDKTSRTDRFLTTFAYANAGEELPRRLSRQSRWLRDTFNRFEDAQEYIRRMGTVAEYLHIVAEFDRNEDDSFSFLQGVEQEQKDLGTFCVLYLADIKNALADPILSIFYDKILIGEGNASSEFIEAAKALSAFFTLWRAPLDSTESIDEVYRQIVGGIYDKKEETWKILPMSWRTDSVSLSANELKKRLQLALLGKYGSKQQWLQKAERGLYYRGAKITVCRFVLFIAAQYSTSDNDVPGVVKPARKKQVRYLTPEKWNVASFREIEHIAPQSNEFGWDSELYKDDQYQLIGNLTLLSKSINSSAKNRSWQAKWLYYKHLEEQDAAELNRLAEANGIELNLSILKKLRESERLDFMESIVNVGIDGNWNAELVQKRTWQICEITWDSLIKWLDD